METGVSTIVPANRLGQLLVEARHRTGADLEAFAARSAFTVGELSDFEAGHRVLNDRSISEITKLYEIDCGPIIPQRAELTIDLDQNLVVASGHALPLNSAMHDHVLERYLSLVYVLRDRDPGTEVPLRGEDIDILAASLAERSELIEEQLLAAMAVEHAGVEGIVGWLKRRLWVPGAGALVGAVSIGTLVMVSAPSEPTTQDIVEPEPEPEPSNRLIPTESASATLSLSSLSQSSAATDPAANEVTTSSIVTPAVEASSVTEQPTTTTTAANTTTTSVATGATPAAVGAQAEELLPFDWQEILPGWEINYLDEDQRFRGLTYPYEKSIDMFVRDNDTPQSLAGILAHELAHAIDVEHFDDGDRNDWRDARGIDDAPWWPEAFARDFETGAGDFAEAFAYWAVGDESSSELGANPTGEQLDLIESYLANL